MISAAPGDPRALHRAQADAAEPDDRDGIAGPDAGRVDHRAHPGEHRAAEQRRLLEVDVAGHAGCTPPRRPRSRSANAATPSAPKSGVPSAELRVGLRGGVAGARAEVRLAVLAPPALAGTAGAQLSSTASPSRDGW